jgi:uncharacterized RDD family membrane protein YckC
MAKRLAVTPAASGAGTAPDRPIETEPDDRIASIGLRSLAFCLDSIVLVAFVMVFAAVGLINLLINSNGGDSTPSDGSIWLVIGLLLLSIPLWLALNVWLAVKRGGSFGQYATGIEVVREDGAAMTAGDHLRRFLAYNPLLFNPVLAVPLASLAYISVALATSAVLLVVSVALVLLFVAGPFVALAAAVTDHSRRGLHDRIAGTVVVRIGG